MNARERRHKARRIAREIESLRAAQEVRLGVEIDGRWIGAEPAPVRRPLQSYRRLSPVGGFNRWLCTGKAT